MSQRALVIGGGIAGVQAALELADSQIEVTLVEESPTLRVNPAENGDKPAETLTYMPKLLKATSHPNISVLTNAKVAHIRGKRGDFKATITVNPRYVDLDLCTSCGRCERACPVDIALPLSDMQDGHKAIHHPDFGLKSVPSACVVDKNGTSPCTAACPAGINAHGYVALIAKGKFTEALDLITESAPFPRVLGRVCNHPCEDQCTRGKIDKPVSICALKRFAADINCTESSLKRAQVSNNGVKPTDPPRVAIIGSGPAGLAAARDLARLGHRSTVFEALPVPGGMVSVGMPRFRLPREVRQADIDDILSLGIEIRTSTPIGRDLTLEDLKNQGYEAILIAVGAHKNMRLGVAGEGLSGVINSIAFLQALNLKQPISVGYKVVVIGGGYTAIDSARTAIRLHCDKVTVLYRRSLEEMPSNPEEITEAREEGVDIEYLVAPVRIIGETGRVIGVECIRMRLGEPDKSGRRRPIPMEGSEFVIEADTVIVAVGQRPDLSFLEGDTTLTDGRRNIVIDPRTMSTKIPGIFAAGDAAHEPGSMIDAIAAGRRAAISIDRLLKGEELRLRHHPSRVKPVKVNLEEVFVPPIEHQQMPCLPHEDRVGNFEEVDLGFDEATAVREAQRCLNCGGCSECLECERACELDAINHKLTTEHLGLDVNAIITAKNQIPGIHSDVYSLAQPSGNGNLSQASAVAASVIADLGQYQQTKQDAGKASHETAKMDIFEPVYIKGQRVTPGIPEPRVGVFTCDCGGNISEVIDVPDVLEYFRTLDGVTYTGEINYACTDEASVEIKTLARKHSLTHVVLAACVCCHLDQICFSCSDRRIICKSLLLNGGEPDGINYEFVNIREHCAWVHYNQLEKATAKTKTLIRAGVARARENRLPIARAIVTVDQKRCRGCGTCESVCKFEAIKVGENSSGIFTAKVDEGLCQDCGTCAAHCPSGALSQNGYSDGNLTASLEAILS
ncbi:FAD-dependent oxidoreductase [Chloroflexota bacterium]